ncbi:hypothetical protein HFO26_33745 [Rhizobium leguminosarum]|uniref:hypothetical protein n=1 Tax=Rhizobium leguminosarum TaxID=384 RepID=UPI001C981883|nr:hypothetical protein [Rhizobium leguminosarum]MBY5735172.1 hypothetical protein [Rhizobium leguminosarum]
MKAIIDRESNARSGEGDGQKLRGPADLDMFDFLGGANEGNQPGCDPASERQRSQDHR